MDLAGHAVLLGALVLATVAGIALRAQSGRLRTGGAGRGGWALAAHTPTSDERVLLLQLSSPVCTPCRQTAAVLEKLTAVNPGVVHSEIDVADQPDVARALHVMRTPTVVAFDRSGAELLRISGVPHAADLRTALEPALTRS